MKTDYEILGISKAESENATFMSSEFITGFQAIQAMHEYASSRSMESQWISVEERFPEAYSELGFSVNVLLYTGGKTPKIGYYDLKQNKFFDDDIRIYAVSHWQPLPENPPTN